jgi:hypothetical protein
MAFSVIEWFVFVFSIIVIVKLLVVSFKPKSWLNIVKPLYKSHIMLFVVELILAAALFYYLLMELTIVQIMATIVLGALLTGMTFAVYGKETIDWAKKLLKQKTMVKRAWLPILIWLALVIWALVSLF